MNTFNLFYAAYFRYLAAVWLLSTADLLPPGDCQLLPHASRLTPYALCLLSISRSSLLESARS
jgi:hypothetical protein